jgi:hypothetical protein
VDLRPFAPFVNATERLVAPFRASHLGKYEPERAAASQSCDREKVQFLCVFWCFVFVLWALVFGFFSFTGFSPLQNYLFPGFDQTPTAAKGRIVPVANCGQGSYCECRYS